MKQLSIIIVTYQSEHDIYDCLDSVWQFCDIPPADLEVIIVDNSQDCESMFSKLRNQYGQDITLIHNTHNGGYGQGNNVGIRQASAPVIMIMNPDVRLCQPIFKTALEAFKKDSLLYMYGMKQLLSPTVKSPLSFDCSRRLNGYIIPLLSTICNKLDLYIPHFMYLQGSCFFVNKAKFEAVGLFDEELFMYGEENDIHWRLRKKFGTHIVYNSKLCYQHLTLDRPMSLATELKMVDSIARSDEKKGVPIQKSYQNFVRYYRTRYFSAYIKKLLKRGYADEHLATIKEVVMNLKQRTI